MSKTISKSNGMCRSCDSQGPSLCFDEIERGWEGYHVSFEICLDCFTRLLSILEDDKEYDISDVYKMMKGDKDNV